MNINIDSTIERPDTWDIHVGLLNAQLDDHDRDAAAEAAAMTRLNQFRPNPRRRLSDFAPVLMPLRPVVRLTERQVRA